MSTNPENQRILKLNSNWMPIGFTDVHKAFPDLVTGAIKALHMSFPQNEDGTWNFDKPEEVYAANWEEWLDMEIRPYDAVIHTPKLTIRIPKIVIATQFSGMPMTTPKMTKHAILERDGFKCAYTGRKFPKETAHQHLNIDHVMPRSRGGKSTWNNLVASSIEINSIKADKTPQEAGLRLLTTPTKPRARHAIFRVLQNDRIDPQWRWIAHV